MSGTGDGYFWADELFVSTKENPAAQGVLTGRHHLAFQAKSRGVVDAFHRVALANGGKDNGAPGERSYHPGYYGAFVLDPDGNNIEAVYHGEATRSAASVRVTFCAHSWRLHAVDEPRLAGITGACCWRRLHPDGG